MNCHLLYSDDDDVLLRIKWECRKRHILWKRCDGFTYSLVQGESTRLSHCTVRNSSTFISYGTMIIKNNVCIPWHHQISFLFHIGKVFSFPSVN